MFLLTTSRVAYLTSFGILYNITIDLSFPHVFYNLFSFGSSAALGLPSSPSLLFVPSLSAVSPQQRGGEHPGRSARWARSQHPARVQDLRGAEQQQGLPREEQLCARTQPHRQGRSGQESGCKAFGPCSAPPGLC